MYNDNLIGIPLVIMLSYFKFLFFLIFVFSVNASVINVNSDQNRIEIDGFCSISEAIHAANLDQAFNECAAGDGDDTLMLHDNILMTLGYFTEDFGSSGLPPITSNVIIEGNGFALSRDNKLSCVFDNIESDSEFRITYITTDGDATFRNLTMENGCSDGPNSRFAGGGAVLNEGVLNLENTQVVNNQAKVVGAIWNLDGSTIGKLKNCELINNKSINAGAIYNSGMIHRIENCNFNNNSAGDFGFGGGILNLGHIEYIKNSIFSNGVADGGGAIYNGVNGVINFITNNQFTENTGSLGAVLLNLNIMNVIQNNNFDSNFTISSGHGTALYNLASVDKLNNNTFSNNAAGVVGGAFFNFADINEVVNNTFSNNTAEERGSAFENAGDILRVENNTFVKNNTISIYNRGLLGSFVGNISSSNDKVDCQNVGTITNRQHNFANSGNCYQQLIPITSLNQSLEDNGCVTPLAGGGCVKTFALLAGSNALNILKEGEMRDQRGYVSNGLRDAGSFEFNSITAVDLIYVSGFE